MWVQIPWTGLKGVPDSHTLSHTPVSRAWEEIWVVGKLWGSCSIWGSVQSQELSLPGEGLGTRSKPDSLRP